MRQALTAAVLEALLAHYPPPASRSLPGGAELSRQSLRRRPRGCFTPHEIQPHPAAVSLKPPIAPRPRVSTKAKAEPLCTPCHVLPQPKALLTNGNAAPLSTARRIAASECRLVLHKERHCVALRHNLVPPLTCLVQAEHLHIKKEVLIHAQ